MHITKKDAGREVRLKNGTVVRIFEFNDGEKYPVRGDCGFTWKTDGSWDITSPTNYDIVEFVDNEKSIVEKLENYITEYYNCASPDQQAMLREIAEDVLRKNIVKSCKLVDIE